jgi:NAD(P)-dependent dehydrogenase (short-subunit alcohol dehydrogenase family)
MSRTAPLLDGKVAVITAAGSGMGRATALLFAGEGATVIVADIDGEGAEAVAAQAREKEGKAESYTVDVADLSQLRALFDFVGKRFGLLDVLHHHAGIPGPAGLDVSEDEWRRTIDVNMRSGFYGTGYAQPLLAKAGKSSVIFTSSVAGLIGSPLSPMYSMTKGGVVLLVKALALSLAPDGIRVNAICPGSVDTPMFPKFFDRYSEEEAERKRLAWVSSIPMKRIGQPEEVASAALFLASDLSSYVTGHALPVDGGITAQ